MSPSPAYRGVTIELIGDSGAGKTTQAGEYAKYVRSSRGRNTILNTADRGGYDSISHLERIGVLAVNELGPEDDPWLWIAKATSAASPMYDESVGCAIFDSGTSMSDCLLTACHKASFQVGQQRTQKFAVARGKETMEVSLANEAHYGLVQQHMLEAIRNSTWLTRKGIDVIWTFAIWRGEAQDKSLILGPKVCGKALTPFLPKEFRFTFRIASIPQEGTAPRHVLYLTEHPELAGLGHSFGNARYPVDATPLPATIEPASLVEAIKLIEAGSAEAEAKSRADLGL